MSTTITSTIAQNINIPLLKKQLESLGVTVLEIRPKSGVVNSEVDLAGTVSGALLTSCQNTFNSHSDQQLENLDLIASNTVVIGTTNAGDVIFKNNGNAWKIDSNKALIPLQSLLGLGTVANPIGTIVGTDLILNGNLSVYGTQTIIHTTNLQVEDTDVELNIGSVAPGASGGISFLRGPYPANHKAQIYWNEGTQKWQAGKDDTLSNITTVDDLNAALATVPNTIGTINSQTKSANGAVISTNLLVFQTADASYPGLVSTGAQSFAGAKTFSSQAIFSVGLSSNSFLNTAGSDFTFLSGDDNHTVKFAAGSTLTNVLTHGAYLELRGVGGTLQGHASLSSSSNGNSYLALGGQVAIYFNIAGSSRWYIDSSGHFVPYGGAANRDIGQPSFEMRNIYLHNIYAGDNSGVMEICGGAGSGGVNGGRILLYGSNYAGYQGNVAVQSGTFAGSWVDITSNNATGTVRISTGSQLLRWTFDAAGNIVQHSSNGQNIVINRTGTGLKYNAGDNGILAINNGDANGTIGIILNGAYRWSFDAAGQLIQDGTNGSNLVLNKETASRALYLDASKNVKASTITATELGYLSGVTSNIQSQLNAGAIGNALQIQSVPVLSTPPTDGQYLKYDLATNKWLPATPPPGAPAFTSAESLKVHSGYAGSEEIKTTNATQSSGTTPTLFSIAINDNSICWFEAKIAGRNGGNGYWAIVQGAVDRYSGTTALVGTPLVTEDTDSAGPSVSVSVVGTNLILSVASSLGGTTNWVGSITYQQVSAP